MSAAHTGVFTLPRAVITEEYQSIIDFLRTDLFATSTHRFSEERASWIVDWIDESSLDTVEQVQSHPRYEFLQQIWNHSRFNPFLTTSEAVHHIGQNPQEFIIRLSSSLEGHLCITYNTLAGVNYIQVRHLRIFVDNQGRCQLPEVMNTRLPAEISGQHLNFSQLNQVFQIVFTRSIISCLIPRSMFV